jgi:hypothetical protein
MEDWAFSYRDATMQPSVAAPPQGATACGLTPQPATQPRNALVNLLRGHRRAAIAPMTALMAPVFLGMTALIVDAGFWIIASTRLQIAADAAAMGDGFLLNTTLKSQTAANQASTMQSVALYEASAAATKLVGSMTTRPTIAVASDWSSVTVTLTSQTPSYFLGIYPGSAPVLRASATASLRAAAAPCVLTLGPTGVGIQVDNMGVVTATKCSIFSKSSGAPSIYLNSGTISGTAVAATGTVAQSNSGSNSMTPTTPTSNSTTTYNDPLAAQATPSPTSVPASGTSNCPLSGSTASNNNYTAWKASAYAFDAQANGGSCVFNGATTIGGNGSTDSFTPGVYYVVNGNLTFNNAALTVASGVSFVMTGSNPGNFSWTNYSNTSTAITAPTTGPTAGVAIWQGCNSAPGSQTASFQGGSTLSVSGTIYMPCSKVDVGNNAQVNAQPGQPFNIEAYSIYAHGSGGIRTNAPAASASANSGPMLTQ